MRGGGVAAVNIATLLDGLSVSMPVEGVRPAACSAEADVAAALLRAVAEEREDVAACLDAAQEELNKEPEKGTDSTGMDLSSVQKKRRLKMNRHKYKKWRKKMRTILRKLK